MGSLWSNDGVGLFLSWMMNPPISNSDRTVRRRDSVGFWNAFASSSKYGVGLFASGAPQFLSSNLALYFRASCSLDGRGQDFSSEQHWTRWLDSPIQGKRGGIGSPFNWDLGRIKSGRSFPPWLGGPPQSSKGKSIVTGPGGGSEEGPSNSTDSGHRNGTLTAAILGLNFLAFLGQSASKGRFLLWGAKVNTLIDQGQLWRLITPSILHANVLHLLINSYSLNSIGPTVEAIAGPRRFLAVYSVSALTSTTLSYFYCSAPSVGASGAIFGVVGALAVFLIRHRNMMVGGKQNLQRVASVIAVNLVLGFVGDGIDNWSHFGGLLGGAAVAWVLGPAYTFEGPPGAGQRQLVDRPPISYLLPSRLKR